MASKNIQAKVEAAKASISAKTGKKTTLKNVSQIDIWRGTWNKDELLQIRRQLAKATNQRLVQLERTKSLVSKERYSEYGAAQILYDYLSQSGRTLASRVSEGWYFDMNHGNANIKREITALQKFINSASSTVKGQKAIESKRLQALSSGEWGGGSRRKLKYASSKLFYNFLNSATFENLIKKGFSSETIVEMYDLGREKLRSNKKAVAELSKALDEYTKGTKAPSKKDLQKRMLKGSQNA